MEQNIVIYIGIYKTLTLIGALIVATWYASHRLTKVETKVDIFEERIKGMEGRLGKTFAGQSPIALLDTGKLILEDSGLKKYINKNKNELLAQCRDKNEMSNPYDIQESAFKFFDQLKFEPSLEGKLKTVAYQHGVDMDIVRRIGGIYFRDICLSALGFTPEDLDRPKTE